MLDLIPPGQAVSVEYEVFPRLVGAGLYAQQLRGLLARHRHARELPRPRTSSGCPPAGLVDPTAPVDPARSRDRLRGRPRLPRRGRRARVRIGAPGRRGCGGGPDGGQSGGGNNWRTRVVAAADPSGMADAIAGMAEQLRQGERVGAAVGVDVALPGAVVIAAMGGSAMGGELLRALVAGECPVPITRVRGFRIPHWAGPGTLVMCVSYSGETEETLACARQAHRQGADLLIVGAGGTLVEPGAGVGGRLRAGARAPSPPASRGPRWATCSARWPARSARAASPPRGSPRRPPRASRPVDGAAARELGERLATDDSADLRRRADRSGRLPVEDADERERQDARLQPRAARARAQRDRRLGGRAPGRVRGRAPVRSRPGRRRSPQHRGDRRR